MLKNFWNNEAGFVISAELTLVLTIAVIGIIVGLSHVAMAVNEELSDVAQAIGSLNQSFSFTGFQIFAPSGGSNAPPYFQVAGSNGPRLSAPAGAVVLAPLSLPAGAASGNCIAPGAALLA